MAWMRRDREIRVQGVIDEGSSGSGMTSSDRLDDTEHPPVADGADEVRLPSATGGCPGFAWVAVRRGVSNMMLVFPSQQGY